MLRTTPRLALLGALVMPLGCTDGSGGFGSGGNRSEWPENSSDTGSSGGDTADIGDEPVITDISAEFDTYPGYDDVVELSLTVYDRNDDLADGTILAAITASNDQSGDLEFPIDDSSAWIEDDGTLRCVFEADTSLTYEMVVAVTDAAGNTSEEAEVSVP